MDYLIHLGVLAAIYAILGLGLNLVVGFAGLLSVTHAAFFGIGAYATGIMTGISDGGFASSLAVGVVVAGALAWILGIVSARFRGDYYALASFGFNVIVYSVLLNWQALTRGPLGIPGIPKPELWGHAIRTNGQFLAFAAITALIAYGIARYIGTSSFGRALKAIREDEDALRVFGYDVAAYKLWVFVIGGMLAAVAGSLFASYISFIDPSTFTLNESVFLLAMIILGGLGSVNGSVLGALFLIALPEALRFVGFPPDIAAQTRQAAYGALLVLLMLYRPQGMIGEYKL